MTRKISLFLMALILILAQNSYSKDLRELIELSKQHPEVLAVKEKLEAAKAKARYVKALPDPMIEFGVSKEEDMNSKSMMVEQAFPYPGKLSLMADVENQQVKMIEQELQDVLLKKIAETKKYYYELFFINKEIEITNRTKEYLKLIEDVANTMYAVGMVPQTDILRTQIEILMQNEMLTMLFAEKEKAIYQLMWRCLGLSLESPQITITFPSEIRQTLDKDYAELQKIALVKSPMLRMTGEELGMKGKEVDLAKRERKPDFVAGADVMDTNRWGIKFGVMYPLYSSKKQDIKVKEAERIYLKIEKNYEDKKLELSAMLKEEYLMLQALDKNIKLYKTSIIPQANLTYASALANYKTGKTDFLMLFDNLMRLQEAELRYYKLLTEYQKKVAEIERLVGGDL